MRLKDLVFPFWLDSDRPGASLETIEQFERQVGCELPAAFKEALLLRDGGVSSYSEYRLADYRVPIPAFLSVEELCRAEENREVFGTPNGIIAVASGGHEWLGLDYRQGSEPKVVFQERRLRDGDSGREFRSASDGPRRGIAELPIGR